MIDQRLRDSADEVHVAVDELDIPDFEPPVKKPGTRFDAESRRNLWFNLAAVASIVAVIAIGIRFAGNQVSSTFSEIGSELPAGSAQNRTFDTTASPDSTASPNTTASPAATAAPETTDTTAAATAGAPSTTGTDPGPDSGANPVDINDLGRDIIFRADVTMAVDDAGDATRAVTAVMVDLGGFVFGQDTVGGTSPSSTVTYRLPPRRFQTALDRLDGLGEIRSQQVSASDVTVEVVDLEARIEATRISVERLRALLAEARDLATIVDLESELLDREMELQSLEARLRTLDDLVDLATIVVTVTEAAAAPEIRLVPTMYESLADGGLRCPGSDGLIVGEGVSVTMCFQIRNTGNTALSGFGLSEASLGLELEDLTLISGDLAVPLEPGGRVMLAASTRPDEELDLFARVEAVPVDASGARIGDSVSHRAVTTVRVVPADEAVGFVQAIRASWDVLGRLMAAGLVALGWVIPFLWVVPLVLGVRWWLRRRSDDQDR